MLQNKIAGISAKRRRELARPCAIGQKPGHCNWRGVTLQAVQLWFIEAVPERGSPLEENLDPDVAAVGPVTEKRTLSESDEQRCEPTSLTSDKNRRRGGKVSDSYHDAGLLEQAGK